VFDFDTPIDRRGTHATKAEQYKHLDAIPMWVADMDFATSPAILEVLKQRVDHGVFGYTGTWDGLNESVVNWLSKQHGWQIDADWLVWLPGVVPSFNAVCRAFSNNQSAIAVQTPNYPPLLNAHALSGAQSYQVPSVLQEGRWTLDFDVLESHLQKKECTLFFLCNPFNPGGSILNKDELDTIVELCRNNKVTLCSDEIHCDIRLDESAKHIPIGRLEPNSITLMSAGKTFNIAGLSCSFAVIPNPKIKQRFTDAAVGMMSWPNLMGLLATETAFSESAEWHSALLSYLRKNRNELVTRINAINGLEVVSPQATYLAWLDATGLQDNNGSQESPFQQFINAGVIPSDGGEFGSKGFVRLNFGCTFATLDKALTRIESCFE